MGGFESAHASPNTTINYPMWKILVGFALFAALALFILTRPGADIDLGGEKHGVDIPAPPTAASPVTPASAAKTTP